MNRSLLAAGDCMLVTGGRPGAAGRWLAALGLPLAAAGLFLYGAGWLPGGERVLEGRRETRWRP